MSAGTQEESPNSGPTVLRILLGAQLRRLREGKGISREDAGYEIRASGSKISRMELGRVSFKERDVADLLSMYGVQDLAEREALLGLARQANNPGWWHHYGDILPAWFQSYLGLEAAATLIRTYEIQFVPGLLQTPEYARAVILLGHAGATADEIDRRVELRRQRQQILQRNDPPQLWAVIDEAVLHRPIGGKTVLRNQLEFLIEQSRRHNVTLQIIPFGKGGYTATGGAFTLLRFNDTDLPDIVYIEHLTSAVYLDKREDLDAYVVTMDALSISAAQPRDTERLIRAVIDEL